MKKGDSKKMLEEIGKQYFLQTFPLMLMVLGLKAIYILYRWKKNKIVGRGKHGEA